MTFPGELWLVDFGDPFPSEPGLTRPALVVGPASAFGDAFPLIFVAPLTSKRRGLNLHIRIEASRESGVAVTGYVQAEGLRSISKARLVRKLGRVHPAEMRAVRTAIAHLLGFDARAA